MKKNWKAFTLVEMLIVVVIIGILASALLPRLSGVQSQARDTARKQDVAQIANGAIAYYAQKGKYPEYSTLTSVEDSGLVGDLTSEGGMNSIPNDPIVTNTVGGVNGYGYTTLSKKGISGAGFMVVAHVELDGAANHCGALTSLDSVEDVQAVLCDPAEGCSGCSDEASGERHYIYVY